jgi:hypothetical protein
VDLVGARRQRRQRPAQEHAVGAVDAAVASIHLQAARVEHAERAVGGLQTLGEVELHLVRSPPQRALDARLRPLQHGVSGGSACGQRPAGERERQGETQLS